MKINVFCVLGKSCRIQKSFCYDHCVILNVTPLFPYQHQPEPDFPTDSVRNKQRNRAPTILIKLRMNNQWIPLLHELEFLAKEMKGWKIFLKSYFVNVSSMKSPVKFFIIIFIAQKSSFHYAQFSGIYFYSNFIAELIDLAERRLNPYFFFKCNY